MFFSEEKEPKDFYSSPGFNVCRLSPNAKSVGHVEVFLPCLRTKTSICQRELARHRPDRTLQSSDRHTCRSITEQSKLRRSSWRSASRLGAPLPLQYEFNNGHGILSGGPETYKFTLNLTDLAQYTDSSAFPEPNDGHLDFEMFLSPAQGNWTAFDDDISIHKATADITHTYDTVLPEPASLALLGFGALLLASVSLPRRLDRNQ